MTDTDSLVIKYWGVRGSVPAPLTSKEIKEKEQELIDSVRIEDIEEDYSRKVGDNCYLDGQKIVKHFGSGTNPSSHLTRVYGGNTTCIEVQAKDSPLMIIDAGTGIRDLGNDLLGKLFSGKNLNPLSSNEKTKKDIHLFFTHYHWDHLQGFPFFAPTFISGDKAVKINFYGKQDARQRLSEVLKGQQQYPNFPVEWEDIACDKEYRELGRMNPSPISLGKENPVIIEYRELDHPDRSFGYSFEVNGKKFACATDTEHRDIVDPNVLFLAKDADVLYYDGQYTPEEYCGKVGFPRVRWGHSTYEWGVKSALAANAKKLVLGHHEPARDDAGLKALEYRAEIFRDEQLELPENKDKKLEVEMAYEGLEQRL